MNTTAIMSLLNPPPANVVEMGCGTGWLSLMLAERGYDVVGLDISPDAIALADQLKIARGITTASFHCADYEETSFDGSADCVVFHDTLHHAESEVMALQAAHRTLRKNGMLICIEPGKGHSQSAQSRHAVEHFGVHEKDLQPKHIIKFAQKAGFTRHLVLPWPWFFLRSTYRPAYSKSQSSADLKGRKLLSLIRLLRSFLGTRDQGLVLLWK